MEFPGVRALDGVDFDVRPGEVHALIGENGAGKSTLIKILSGEIGGYEGEVRLDGTARRWQGPRAAIGAGIAVIPQELQLVASLSVAGNIFLGRPRSLLSGAKAALETVGETHVQPEELVSHLEAGQRQLVAIARALSLDARLIIMDEPTMSLSAPEAARLESLIERLCARGVSIVYISHKLDEIERLADRITVLRDGRRIVTRDAEGVGEAEMVRLMVGRQIDRGELLPVAADAPELLRVENLSVEDRDRPATGCRRVSNVSFSLRRGEILGLAGLIGAGRTDLLLALTGALERPVTGRVRLAGTDYRPSSPAAAKAAGLVLLPEERKSQAIFPDLSVEESVVLPSQDRAARAGWIDRRRSRDDGRRLMADTGVRAASPEVPIATLSGGNQQKAILARCLYASPSVLLLDEPTRGIDLAAKADVYALLRRLAGEGFGIVLC